MARILSLYTQGKRLGLCFCLNIRQEKYSSSFKWNWSFIGCSRQIPNSDAICAQPRYHSANIAIGKGVSNKNGGRNFQPFASSMDAQRPTSDISILFIFCTNHLRSQKFAIDRIPWNVNPDSHAKHTHPVMTLSGLFRVIARRRQGHCDVTAGVLKTRFVVLKPDVRKLCELGICRYAITDAEFRPCFKFPLVSVLSPCSPNCLYFLFRCNEFWFSVASFLLFLIHANSAIRDFATCRT
jgi:hypothetical protein